MPSSYINEWCWWPFIFLSKQAKKTLHSLEHCLIRIFFFVIISNVKGSSYIFVRITNTNTAWKNSQLGSINYILSWIYKSSNLIIIQQPKLFAYYGIFFFFLDQYSSFINSTSKLTLTTIVTVYWQSFIMMLIIITHVIHHHCQFFVEILVSYIFDISFSFVHIIIIIQSIEIQ